LTLDLLLFQEGFIGSRIGVGDQRLVKIFDTGLRLMDISNLAVRAPLITYPYDQGFSPEWFSTDGNSEYRVLLMAREGFELVQLLDVRQPLWPRLVVERRVHSAEESWVKTTSVVGINKTFVALPVAGWSKSEVDLIRLADGAVLNTINLKQNNVHMSEEYFWCYSSNMQILQVYGLKRSRGATLLAEFVGPEKGVLTGRGEGSVQVVAIGKISTYRLDNASSIVYEGAYSDGLNHKDFAWYDRNTMLIVSGTDVVNMIDFSNPAMPSLIASLVIPEGPAVGIKVDDGRAAITLENDRSLIVQEGSRL